ncbi:hypothetical protein [Micromonospora sp. NPDC004704]
MARQRVGQQPPAARAAAIDTWAGLTTLLRDSLPSRPADHP